jgi:hypothetical protein
LHRGLNEVSVSVFLSLSKVVNGFSEMGVLSRMRITIGVANMFIKDIIKVQVTLKYRIPYA